MSFPFSYFSWTKTVLCCFILQTGIIYIQHIIPDWYYFDLQYCPNNKLVSSADSYACYLRSTLLYKLYIAVIYWIIYIYAFSRHFYPK